MGTVSVIMKEHSYALADGGERQFDILPRSAASEPGPNPGHQSLAGAGHVAQGVIENIPVTCRSINRTP